MSDDLASSSEAMSDTPAVDSPTLAPLVMDAAGEIVDQLFAVCLDDAITGALSASASAFNLPTQGMPLLVHIFVGYAKQQQHEPEL